MIKKSFCILLTLLLISSLFSFNNYSSANEVVEYKNKRVSVMDTTIAMKMFSTDEKYDNYNTYFTKGEEILHNLHYLTDNFNKYDGINNVAYINDNVGKQIEVDEVLYNILYEAEKYRIYTNGYFDVSIGKIIDEWKWLINLSTKLSNKEFKEFKDKVLSIPVIENGILLETIDSKYYVTISQGVKIDLGAIAKGYAVQAVNDYFRSEGLVYFQIEGSQSSLMFGKNGKAGSDGYYNIGISNPKGGIAEVKSVMDTAVTTSGDTVQGVKYGKRIYHHIISPKSKMPENINRLITIINPDATLSDVLTTAMFSMPDDVRENWINSTEEIEYILFKFDSKGDDILKTATRDWIIISVIVIIIGVGFAIFSKAFKSVKFNQSTVSVNKEELVIVHFKTNKVEVLKNQVDIPAYNTNTYPIINEENKTITVLGLVEEYGIRQELVIEYNFEKHSMQIIEEVSPNNICKDMGVSTGMALVCEPNSVIVTFQNGTEDVDHVI